MPELSENQQRFVRDAEHQGLTAYFDYSGRGMFGETCPAVNVDYQSDLNTEARYSTDSMGLGYVLSARS